MRPKTSHGRPRVVPYVDTAPVSRARLPGHRQLPPLTMRGALREDPVQILISRRIATVVRQSWARLLGWAVSETHSAMT
jgi:hypothetical protein